MVNTKEKSLSEALQYCMLTELPEKEDGENIWIRAIALVQKVDSSLSYAYVEKNTETLETEVKYDFGRSIQINKIIECYPFCYLDANYIPKFKDGDVKSRVKYLETNVPGIDFSKMKESQLDKEVLKIAITNQLKKDKGAKYE